jgi:hypothetical protein
MGLKVKLLSLLLGFIFLLLIMIFIRKNTFKPAYTFLWIMIAFFLLSVPLFETFYKWIASTVIGIVDARHIIYIVIIGFLMIYSFMITIKISKLADQIQELISFTAILQHHIEDIETNMKAEDSNSKSIENEK